MNRLLNIGLVVLMLAFNACTEDIVIDVEKGEPMVGVEASFTDELKHHEAILSYSAEFYNEGDIRMISGATVYVTDGADTVYYIEDSVQRGHYFTDLVAGRKNTMYHLGIEVVEPDGSKKHLWSESYMPDNVESIDSLVIKHFNGGNDTIPSTFLTDTIEWLYPYFQTLPDPTIIYMPMISKNDTMMTDSLKIRMMIPQGGFAGYYVNGPEMQQSNKEIPIGYFRRSTLKDGDRIHAYLYSITQDYFMYFYTLLISMGSNPMMGAPANVSTNIQPEGEGVGWFFTASVVSKETVFRK